MKLFMYEYLFTVYILIAAIWANLFLRQGRLIREAAPDRLCDRHRKVRSILVGHSYRRSATCMVIVATLWLLTVPFPYVWALIRLDADALTRRPWWMRCRWCAPRQPRQDDGPGPSIADTKESTA